MRDKRNELELKLLVSEDFQLPSLVGEATGIVGAAEQEPLQLSSVYFDTPDLRLLRQGVTLRHRTGDDGGPIWTLKLPVNGGDHALRSEMEFSGAAEEPPSEARTALFGLLNSDPLNIVAVIKTRRRRWSLSAADGSEMAELVDDSVSVLEGSEIKDSFREIEIEARGIDRAGLQRIAGVIRDAGARPEQRSKASRAVEALRGVAPGIRTRSLPSPDDPAGKAVAPALEDALSRLLTYDPYARVGEIEGVHQLRVAGRRLRTVLRTFAPLLDEEKMDAAHAELRWLGQALSDVRDLDVFTEGLHQQAGATPDVLAPVFDTLAERHTSAEAALTAALTSERYAALVHRLRELVADEEFVVQPGGPIDTELPHLAWLMWRKLEKAGGELGPDSAEADFHRARILSKRARYAADTIAEFLPTKAAKRLRTFAIAAEAVQNVLGEHLDATYARETLLGLAPEFESNGRLSLELGRLVERYERIATSKRRDFFKQWRKLDRKGNLEWAHR